MFDYKSVGDVARMIGARPQDITSAFYKGLLRDDLCPIMGGRRLIPETYIGMIRMALKRDGKKVAAEVMPRSGGPKVR